MAYAFPQQATPLSEGTHGIATFKHPNVGTLRLRTNPNEFGWTYTLNKRIDNTYGGRVVQLLGTKIDDFTLKADSGGGRWEYTNLVAKFMRDCIIAQRHNGGTPVTFEYTTRGWKLNCYIVNVPFQDAIEEVKREFSIQMKVEEDISGVMSKNTLDAELSRLQDGMNYKRGQYNDPRYNPGSPDFEQGLDQTALVENVVNSIGQAGGILGQFSNTLNFLPNGVGGTGQSFSLGNLINPVNG